MISLILIKAKCFSWIKCMAFSSSDVGGEDGQRKNKVGAAIVRRYHFGV